MKLSRTSIALLLIQLVLVFFHRRQVLLSARTVSARLGKAAAYDPELVMRGRYLSLQLTVDGCESTLPTAFQAEFPRNSDGSTRKGRYMPSEGI